MFNKLCSFPNLMLAAHKAAKNKRGKASTIDFIFSLESELFALQRTLTARTWKPGGYRTFRIHDPKERTISAAPFRDRVVHHALCNIIEPVFERGFIFDSYANRVGKGSHRAIERFQQYARYCCSCSPDCCCCAFARNNYCHCCSRTRRAKPGTASSGPVSSTRPTILIRRTSISFKKNFGFAEGKKRVKD